jgi:sulfopyruvate decarboxylase subunit alpha
VILDRSARVIIKSVVVGGESYRTPLQVSLLSDKQGQVTSLIVEQLAESGIKLVASLPDDWIAPLIHAVDKDDRFTHVPINREESAIGLCSGAFFGGIPSMALMGASGLMTCVYAITKINYTYQIPLFIFATLRGVIGDPRPHHISNGLYLTRLLDSISLPFLIVEEQKTIARIPDAFKHCRAMNRPEMVIFTEAVLRGEA